MIAKLKAGLISLRDLLATAWWIILILAVAFIAGLQFVKPAPPKHIIITTGAEGGAYFRLAGRYSAILARNGIALEVRTSEGALENLRRLEKNEADVAFLQGGIIVPEEGRYDFEESPSLSLGSVFYEPVWVFYRGDRKIDRLSQLAGKRIAIGQEGSGVRQLAQQLLAANHITTREHLVSLGGLKAAEELQQGRIDAAFIIAAPEAPVVQALLHAKGIQLMSFAQAEGYTKQFPFLTVVKLPRGAVDVANDMPPEDTALLAATASLVVRDDLHPALQALLLQAAAEVHGKIGFFQRPGEFPSPRNESLPLADEAKRYYKNGPPFLQRYLPFWLAVLIDRLIVLALPLIALLLPLLRVAPALYTWRVRSRIFRLYGELKYLEHDLRSHFEAAREAEYRQRLDNIETEANNLSIPLGFTDQLYTLREHINLARQTLARQSTEPQ